MSDNTINILIEAVCFISMILGWAFKDPYMLIASGFTLLFCTIRHAAKEAAVMNAALMTLSKTILKDILDEEEQEE